MTFQKLLKTMSIKVNNEKGQTKNIDHDGTRTHNLPIRSRTPYPLGHAAGRSLLVQGFPLSDTVFQTTVRRTENRAVRDRSIYHCVSNVL